MATIDEMTEILWERITQLQVELTKEKGRNNRLRDEVDELKYKCKYNEGVRYSFEHVPEIIKALVEYMKDQNNNE